LAAGICFAEAERNAWNGLPESRKSEFFYRLWTRKESFIKAVGVDLGLDASRVVSLLAGAARFLLAPREYGQLWIELKRHIGSWFLTAPMRLKRA
jgi:4'-phosphopantetheinyl transferase